MFFLQIVELVRSNLKASTTVIHLSKLLKNIEWLIVIRTAVKFLHSLLWTDLCMNHQSRE